jgi:hypothetical protein
MRQKRTRSSFRAVGAVRRTFRRWHHRRMEQVTPAELQRAFLALGLGALLGLAMALLSRRRG